MQIIEKICMVPDNCFDILHLYSDTPKEKICVFDIETTGFSPRVSSLYLIGVLWFDSRDGKFHVRQWFADDYISEKEILTHFSDFLRDFSTLVHYNGSGFDLPYIEKKCKEHHLASPFTDLKTLDIFKEIRPFKKLFQVTDFKLTTAERFAGFLRKDLLSGRDCIETYSQFMQKKFFKDNTLHLSLEKLLLHNEEDLFGTCHCAKLLAYNFPGSFSSVSESNTSIQITYDAFIPVPFPLQWEQDECMTLRFEERHIYLELVPYRGVLCHFFSPYKDYYYLPEEDTAIHKSVGTYVDKEHRQPAKASNCYIKKQGCFLPVPEKCITDNHLIFRDNYKAKKRYLLWDSKTKQDFSLFEEILQSVMPSVVSSSNSHSSLI